MKDYDSTLARMAGNIAAGFASRLDTPHLSEERKDDIAQTSLDIADRIITRAKRMQETKQALRRNGA